MNMYLTTGQEIKNKNVVPKSTWTKTSPKQTNVVIHADLSQAKLVLDVY